ncbi:MULTISPECIES: NUDIX hydrolase [Actinoplanes]|uniref:NUDIX hydrolase n=1 Tax=Actinoplanes TaxID=1865 RepID=UPI0005F29552|nr:MULTISPECIES: NUDIX hydrolase [Actinoplanes]GLY03711.1 putative hydrolase MutT/NUDIX [Actinoplanes sp. NBRC 101535]
MTEPERAAGGVLYRPAAHGLEVCLVHRPRYDDWSLPKGKLRSQGREDPLSAAVREVHEETGTAGIPQLRLPGVGYVLSGGRRKTVAFWLMRAGDTGPVRDTAEVDAVEWLPLSVAAARLTYVSERRLLDHVAVLPPVTAVIALVRHAHAGERKKWAGRDSLRPIDPAGAGQATRLAGLLAPLAPRRLVSAPPLRCTQTLAPLADALRMPVILDGAFAEPGDRAEVPARVVAAAARLGRLRADERVVVCSQGKLMPHLLAHLHGVDDPHPFKTPKGDGWLLTWSGERLLGAERL